MGAAAANTPDFQRILGNVRNHVPEDCSVDAVFLFGSRASHRNTPNSDIDILVLGECGFTQIVFHEDGFRYAVSSMRPDILDADRIPLAAASFFTDLCPVWDPRQYGPALRAKLNDAAHEGARLSDQRKAAIEARIDTLRSTHAKRCAHNPFSEETLRLKHALLRESLDLAFLYHGQPDPGCKKGVDLLLRDDPNKAMLFGKAALPSATFEDVDRWLDAAFTTDFRADFFNGEFAGAPHSFEITLSDAQGKAWTLRDLALLAYMTKGFKAY